jgi:effector-binding domain-containing protein
LEGVPLTRFAQASAEMVTVEPGMRIASGAAPAENSGDSDILTETLPGGAVATTMHQGSYENLHDAYAAIEEWMKAEGLTAGSAPWECYLNDPGKFPDPKDWKTEVFWPIGA